MKKKILIAIDIIFVSLLAVGISYALISNYLSNTVTATVNVLANSNIVGWWKFDENTGTTVGDISHYINTGTINGASWSSSCKKGYCLSFDGIDDYTESPSSSSLDTTDAITMEAWVKLNSGGTDSWYDIIRRSTGYEMSIQNANQGIIEIALNDGSWHWYDSTSSINLDGTTWYYIATTWNKTTGKLRIYINGNLNVERDAITTSLQPSGNFWVGGAGAAWSTFGNIDGVRIWNIELSSDDIQRIYQSGGL